MYDSNQINQRGIFIKKFQFVISIIPKKTREERKSVRTLPSDEITTGMVKTLKEAP
jgi:hypothetical protein